MGKQFLIWLVLLSVLAGCASEAGTGTNDNDNTGNGQEVQMGDVFTLGLGGEAFIAAEELHLRFDSVLEDSRCPTNVTCVWAGQARIAVSVWQGSAGTDTLEFNTNPDASENLQEHTYQGFTIRLDSLDPYPADTVAIPDDDYRATFQISPAG